MRWDPDLYKRALDFAARAHGDQRVPGSGAPYVVHLTKVTMETMCACVADASLRSELAVPTAMLHDSLEDTATKREELVSSFGEAVAAGVSALTKDKTLDTSAKMADSLRRIQAAPREVWVVKLADRITNLEPPPPGWSLEKRRAYHAEAQVILKTLGSASTWLRERFEAHLVRYEQFTRGQTDIIK